MSKKVKILVLFYSFSGNTAKLAKYVAEGAASVADTDVLIRQAPELLTQEFFSEKPELKKMRDALDAEYPTATIDDLLTADGIAFGTPVHFGSFASQLKQFIDQLTPAWLQGKLVNKPASVFCSGGSQHGGDETTLASLMTPLITLGMIPVGIPYPIQGESPDFDAGSPYGAIFVAGHGRREIPEADKKVARILGVRLATMTKLLNCDCASCTSCREQMKKL